ncbi:hypothetical protein JB92DRAFT_2842788 [Gautieria morchelliformis]|nr:hypothetical protein JB92DRAFT_2842788 [Gautieria morchelliformis]
MLRQQTPAIARISWRVFVIFAIFNALWIPIIYLFFPEIKVRTVFNLSHSVGRVLSPNDL